jgi:diguanylate cyclase
VSCRLRLIKLLIVAEEEERQNMDDKKLVEETRGYIRLVLPLMSQLNIPITPRNYSVWYKYVSASDNELSSTIDAMRENGEEFSEEKNETLYWRFCAEKGESELKKFQEDLKQILLTVFKEVTELTGQAQEYELLVTNSVNSLSEDASVQDIKNVISKISNETKTLGKYVKGMQHKLKETSETLEAIKKDFEHVKTEASVDFLTGVPNRKTFDNRLTACISEALAGNLSLLMIDIDHFKRFNDEHGHLVGDEVLKFTARKVKEIVKGKDFLARFGGEEFAVILPQTHLAGAKVVAENIRSFFAKATLEVKGTSKKLGTITVSVGAACYRPDETSEEFIKRSDQALYFAKNTGRNRVATEADSIAAK